VIITGAKGRLGSELVKHFPHSLTPDKSEFDITNPYQMIMYLMGKKIHTIINCAAMTNTTECERNPRMAYDINSFGVKHLTDICDDYGIRLIHISTDHVFDGEKGDCKETDETNPKGHYAYSKYLGELYANRHRHLIIRTSFMKDFNYDKAFTDKYWSGMWVDEVAKEITRAVNMYYLKGIYHIAGERKSIYEFVKERYPNIKPIKLKDNPIARCGLPYLKDTSLNTEKWKNAG
jgi:dTDP-4-dehydrorhamnose reductase